MGESKFLYLGPYAECTQGDPQTGTREVRGCTNPKCKKHPKDRDYTRDEDEDDSKNGDGTQQGQFCPACGSKVDDVVITETFYPDRYELVGDALFEVQSDGERGGDVLLLAPNERRKGDPQPKGLNEGESLHLDLSRVDRAAEMAWFEQAFAKELAIVRKSYATVTIKWGLHQFFM